MARLWGYILQISQNAIQNHHNYMPYIDWLKNPDSTLDFMHSITSVFADLGSRLPSESIQGYCHPDFMGAGRRLAREHCSHNAAEIYYKLVRIINIFGLDTAPILGELRIRFLVDMGMEYLLRNRGAVVVHVIPF